MTGGLGLGVLGASHVGHARDGTRRGARGWCKSRGLEVVGRNVRREGKSRGRQGGEPGARGRIVTIEYSMGQRASWKDMQCVTWLQGLYICCVSIWDLRIFPVLVQFRFRTSPNPELDQKNHSGRFRFRFGDFPEPN
jgi:hypothetical protein